MPALFRFTGGRDASVSIIGGCLHGGRALRGTQGAQREKVGEYGQSQSFVLLAFDHVGYF